MLREGLVRWWQPLPGEASLTANGALLSEGTAAEAGEAASGPVEDRSRGEFSRSVTFLPGFPDCPCPVNHKPPAPFGFAR